MFQKTATMFAMLALLAGCVGVDSSAKPERPEKPEVSIATSGEFVDTVEQITADTDINKTDYVLSTTPNMVTIVLGGSGSCPTMISNIDYSEEANLVTFSLYEYPDNIMCTMDYGQYVYEAIFTEPLITDDTGFQQCTRGECRLLTQ